MKIIRFEDLEIWRQGVEIAKAIYALTQKPVFKFDFGLKEQIQRAAVSISSNIVEGFEKNSNNEFIRFLKIAKGSAGEVRNQLYIALSLNYIQQDEFSKLNEELIGLASRIGKFISYLENKRKNGEFRNY